MPAASNAIVKSWIPRGTGKGGIFTSATYHDADPESTYSVLNCVVDHNTWRVRYNDTVYGVGAIRTNFVNSIEVFNRYSGILQTITSSVVGAAMIGPVNPYVANWTTGSIIRDGASPLPLSANGGQMSFASVKNRLYMANGTDPPAISPDATANSCQPWGFAPQATNLAYQISAPGTGNNINVVGGTQGTCNTTNVANSVVTWVSGPTFEYFTVGAVMYINGVYHTIKTWTSTTQVVLNDNAGLLAGVPFSYAPTGIIGNANYTGAGGVQATGTVTLLTTLTWNSGIKFDTILVGSTIYVAGRVNTVAAIASATVLTLTNNDINGGPYNLAYGTVAGGTNVAGLNTLSTWAPSSGFPAFIVGPGPPPMTPSPGSACFIAAAASPATPAVKYTFTVVTGVAAGTINPTYAEQTGGSVVTRNTQINFSNITSSFGASGAQGAYQYAVSYFNPTSGHVSNTSPVLNIKDGAPNNVSFSTTISNIVTTNDTNYTKIILWRSGLNTSTMYPLTILNNNLGNAALNTITYTDFMGDDTALGTAIGGPGKLPAPIGQNAQPPTDLNYIAYWDGRFWGASQTQIGVLFFSARSSPGNSEDITVGVAEECWPPNFTRPIPESDGKITGLRTVSNNLFVLTDNNIYTVVGGNQLNYGLVRVSSKGRGTSQFKTCTIPAEDVNSSDVMVHFGNDKRLYFLFGSGGDFDISYPVQDQLINAVALGVQHTPVSSYVVAAQNNRIYLYDLERKIWLKRTLTDGFGATAYCEGLVSGAVFQLFGSANTAGTIYQAEQQTGTPSTFAVQTNQFSPGGERKDDKTLQAVAIYYSNRTDTLAVHSGVDNTPLSGVGLITLTEVPNTGQYAAFFEETDARIFTPQGTMARGRVFYVEVDVNTVSTFQNAIYEIRAVFSDSTSPEAKGANL